MNARAWRPALAIACAACFTGAASAGEFRGRLLLGERAVPGATVAAIPYESPLEEARREARTDPPPQPLKSTTSGPDGAFDLKVPVDPTRSRLFTLRIEGIGIVATSLGGVWDASDSEDLGEHGLVSGHPLTGKVTDPSGRPLPNVEVSLIGRGDPLAEPDLEPATRTARTAPDGSFRIDGASAKGSVLLVDKPGFLGARVTVAAGETHVKPIVLGGGVSMSGVVRKPDRVTPAPGTLVRIEGDVTTRWSEAGADGTFMIPNAPPGSVTAVADAGDGGYAAMRGIRLPLAKGSPLEMVLQPPSGLVGRTVDAKTGHPVPRARIEVRNGGMSRAARSGPDGAYAVRNLPPGAWRVRVDERRYVSWTRNDVRMPLGETKTLDVPLVLGATLSGRIVDEDGRPIFLAEGHLVAPSASSTGRLPRRGATRALTTFRTRPDGTFKADRLSPGENRVLTVSHPMFETATIGGLSLASGAAKAGVAMILKRGVDLVGRIKDQGALPVAGAEVTLSQPPRAFGGGRAAGAPPGASDAARKLDATGAEGTFAIHGVAPGEYVLTVKCSGYATERVSPIKVPATGRPPAVDVTLAPGAQIVGLVLRGEGTGADGFTVSALPSGTVRSGGFGAATSEQPTGMDGAFFIDGLKPGQAYDLELSSAAGQGAGKRGVVAPASDVRLAAAGTGRIAGVARDAATGHPISDFLVAYVPERGIGPLVAARGAARGDPLGAPGGPMQPVSVHDDGGVFDLEGVPAGTWSVVVSATGHQLGRVSGVVVEDGGSRDNVEVRLLAGSSLKGRVVDAVTGSGIPNAVLSVGPSGSPQALGALLTQAVDGDVTSDPEGRFELDGVGSGTQTVRAIHPDYTDATQSVDVKEGGATAEIRMTAGGIVGGTVVSDTGQPVPGANVSLLEAGSGGFGFGGGGGGGGGNTSVMTDGTGRFRFDHVGAGRYTVNATVGAQTGSPQTVVLQAGDDQEALVIPLQAGVTIQGTVSGVPEASLGGVTITANSTGSYMQSSHSAADGTFELDHVPIGVVSLRGTLTDASGSTRTARQQVTTSADQPIVSAQLVFDQGFTLSGHITHVGQPAAGSNVSAAAQGGGGRQASAIADDAGAYRLEGLPSGTFTVRATTGSAGAVASKAQIVGVTADQTVDIDIPGSTIAGQVVDAASKSPVPSATVTISPKDPAASPGGRRTARSDSDGRFTFTDLDPASYAMTTSKSDYQVDTRVVVADDQNAGDSVIALVRADGIAVSLVDGLARVPLRNAMVCVVAPGGAAVFGPASISLDDAGQGQIPAVQPGSYTIFAAAAGYAVAHLDGVNVPSSTLPIALTPGGSILVQAGPKTIAAGPSTATLTTETGQAAMLSIFNRQGRLSISQPTTQMRNVAPGRYVLSVPSVEFSDVVTVAEAGTAVVQLP